jgi:Uma2 family endonuclease
MSTTTTVTGPPERRAILPPGRVPYRLSVERYEAMIATGVFTKADRFELIEGVLVEKMTKGNEHRLAVQRAFRAITAVLPAGWHATKEDPIRLPARQSEPEPDVAVVRGDIDDYAAGPPGPGDVALVVEAAASSVAADRALAATYLGGGIVVYWLVNLADRALEVHRSGEPVQVLGETDSVDLVLDGQVVWRIAVAELLPRRPRG